MRLFQRCDPCTKVTEEDKHFCDECTSCQTQNNDLLGYRVIL